ncbi:VOC family protein, partial [Stenotrophomonas sp. YIM B06876]|uniref:VOC family protein n=1 Tax=Stenotrophomonas sp. YIM B06876 TaxID=3060211 RepID=UPI0027395F46
DRAAAEHWYESTLGLRRQPELAFWASDRGPLTITNAEGTVHLALFERPHEKCRSVIALGVSAQELFDWQRHLTEVLGEKPVLEDHGTSWSLYFRDPDGNPYEITTCEHEAFAQLNSRTDARPFPQATPPSAAS